MARRDLVATYSIVACDLDAGQWGVAVLPIGGHFTMDPPEAAVACDLLGVKRVVPCHYGTFPLLGGTPEELKQLARGVEVQAIDPGESIEL